MLELTRAIQETVIVGEDHGPHRVMKVTVLAIQGDRVRLGFELETQPFADAWEVQEPLRDGGERPPVPPRYRTAFNTWLNGRARGGGLVETFDLPEEVDSHDRG